MSFLKLVKNPIEKKNKTQSPIKEAFGNALQPAFPKNLNFFLLKFNKVCTFWIVLIC